ncbi:MAG: hypothetical protein VB095_05210, partial [Anaerovorax sp.]|nr:hypothetical protein [Anaerovorax sp.]
MKKQFSVFILLLLVIALVFSACQMKPKEQEPPVQETLSIADDIQKTSVPSGLRPQDDYYNYINAEWLEQVDLEEEGPRAMRMTELQNKINQQLQEDFEGIVKTGTDDKIGYLADAVTLYRLFTDTEMRNKNGIKALMPYLEQVENVQTMEALQKVYYRLIVTGTPVPFKLEVIADSIDPSKNSLIATTPSTFLPDISYYEEDHPHGQSMLQERSFIIQNLAILAGSDEAAATQMAADALSFDKILSSYMLSSTEQQKMLLDKENYVPFAEFCAYSNAIDFETLISDLAGDTPDT